MFIDGRFGETALSKASVELVCSVDFSEDVWTDCTVSDTSCAACGGDAIKCFSKIKF